MAVAGALSMEGVPRTPAYKVFRALYGSWLADTGALYGRGSTDTGVYRAALQHNTQPMKPPHPWHLTGAPRLVRGTLLQGGGVAGG